VSAAEHAEVRRVQRRSNGYAIGEVAALMGVAPETLRSWGRRYGLVPSATTAGGHRRYSDADLARLARMHRLVAEGATPARAAAAVLAAAGDGTGAGIARPALPCRAPRPGGPGGRVLAIPGGSPEARGIARAAGRLDADGLADQIRRLLVERGAVAAWQDNLHPVFVAAGTRWQRSGEGIELEHLLSEVAIDELRAHRLRQPRPAPDRPVLLACFPDDLHSLPLHVLSAALAEVRVGHRVLGARLPLTALAAAARRTGARSVFLWRQLRATQDDQLSGTHPDPAPRGADVLAALPRTRPAIRVVVGGAGWRPADLPPHIEFAPTLTAAVTMIRAARP
jgi:hypothetical protein